MFPPLLLIDSKFPRALFLLILLFLKQQFLCVVSVCVSVCMCSVCVCVCHGAHMGKSELVLSFHYMGSKDQTQSWPVGLAVHIEKTLSVIILASIALSRLTRL